MGSEVLGRDGRCGLLHRVVAGSVLAPEAGLVVSVGSATALSSTVLPVERIDEPVRCEVIAAAEGVVKVREGVTGTCPVSRSSLRIY